MSDLTYDQLHERVSGGILAAALGDAMGAATEQYQIDEIIAKHGGLLKELIDPPADTFSTGQKAGWITDDVSQMLALSEAIIHDGGALTRETWAKRLVRWSVESRNNMQMGPSTRPIMEALQKGESIDHVGSIRDSARKYTEFGASNGAAMRVGPAGLVNPGNIDAAVRLAWTQCYPTHLTQIAAAGAGAIAAGTAVAMMPGADVFSVVKACLEGARIGEELGAAEGRRVAGASVEVRIQIAVEEALKAPTFEQALRRIEATVGNSVLMVEAVPAAVGVFVAAAGDPFLTAVGATNIGNDTDTIGAIAGPMAGALNGSSKIPQAMRDLLIAVNDEYDIPNIIEGLARIAAKNLAL